MLTRIYIDNFRCFTNFEFRPRRKELIFGRNGSGKSSMADVLLGLRIFLMTGAPAREIFSPYDRTTSDGSMGKNPDQRFELDAEIEGATYSYRLALHHSDRESKVAVLQEDLLLGGRPLLQLRDQGVTLAASESRGSVSYPFNPLRSALTSIPGTAGYLDIERFLTWVGSLYAFKLNPFDMINVAGSDEAPTKPLRNFASWYQACQLSLPRENQRLLQDLSKAIEGFTYLTLDRIEKGKRLLNVEFEGPAKFLFTELSDGQRCLICLYSILNFLMANGATVMFDEPDNFVGLREIQPWLMALDECIDDGKGQALVISHHPEILNQWAPGSGTQLFREGNRPVRVKPFGVNSDTGLEAAELIARGWLDE